MKIAHDTAIRQEVNGVSYFFPVPQCDRTEAAIDLLEDVEIYKGKADYEKPDDVVAYEFLIENWDEHDKDACKDLTYEYCLSYIDDCAVEEQYPGMENTVETLALAMFDHAYTVLVVCR